MSTVLETGVYQTAQRYTAIVYRVGRSKVYLITMRSGAIELESMAIDTFKREFIRYFPGYPVRRAVRVYLESDLRKTDSALSTLRSLSHH